MRCFNGIKMMIDPGGVSLTMRIAFVHNSKAFLPEVAAYTRYFSKLGYECEVVTPEELLKLKPDVAWHFMGMDRQAQQSVFTIHEYTSASMPPFADFKDVAKKILNVKPHYRLFLNEYVKKCFAFSDNVPYGYRDMGVNADWLTLETVPDNEKDYDFIYVGALKNRNIEDLLDLFKKPDLAKHSVLVLSSSYAHFQNKYEEVGIIEFLGPVPHEELHEYIRSARYAINFMPNIEPFNKQTSTKFLEYCACKVPVITSDYEWVRKFEEKYGGRYFYLKDDSTWDDITNFKYEFPDLSQWTWEKQIERSGIVEVLEKLR